MTFFSQLSDMIEELFDYMVPLQEFDYASKESDLVCNVRCDTKLWERRTDL